MLLNTVYNCDCIEGIRSKVPNESVDLVVTDPPYLTAYKTNHRKSPHKFSTEIANDRLNRGGLQLINNYFVECYRVLKENSAIYVFCSSKTVGIFSELLTLAGFNIKNQIIWVKNNHTAGDLKAQYGQKYEVLIFANKGRKEINGKRLTDIWEFDRVAGPSLVHQNQKPIALIEQCLLKSSCENDVVLDGFMGSGTTAVACLKNNRNFIGFELDKDYYNICVDRIDEFIGS